MLNNLLLNYNLYIGLSLGCVIGAVLCAIFIIVVVLIQPGNSSGISALGGNSDTFYNKGKGKTLESKLKKLTYVCIFLIILFMIGFFLIDLFF